MRTEIQFSIFLINKPGILAQVLTALAREKVNIIAMTRMDSVENGVLRLVAARPSYTREILKHLNLQVNETEVLCVNLSNKPGSLAGVAARLSEAHININYCYVTAGARGGRTTGVLKVADLKKAMKILEKTGQPAKTGKAASARSNKKLRSPPGRRGR